MAYPSPQGYPGAPFYPAAAPPPPKKSGNKGCLIALAVVGGLALLAVVGVAIAIYAISQNEEVRKIASVVGEGVDIWRDAQSAPGTGELRKLGCDQAFVLDAERLARLGNRLTDAGAAPEPSMPSQFVMCVAAKAGSAPSCDTAAKTYLGAAPKPSKPFAVTVQVQNAQKAECAELYQPDGSKLGSFDGSTAPQVPSSTDD